MAKRRKQGAVCGECGESGHRQEDCPRNVREPQLEEHPVEEPSEEEAPPPPPPEEDVVIPVTPPAPVAKPNGVVPERKLQPVTLKVFLAGCGVKPDQQAGFAYHARKRFQPTKRFTIPEWKELWANFEKRPTGRR